MARKVIKDSARWFSPPVDRETAEMVDDRAADGEAKLADKIASGGLPHVEHHG